MLTSAVTKSDGVMRIIDELDQAGYEVWAPAVRDGVLVTRPFRAGDELGLRQRKQVAKFRGVQKIRPPQHA